MTNANNDRLLIALYQAIEDNGGVPCEQVPHIFYPEDQPQWNNRLFEIREAKAICGTCPVMKECFTYGVVTQQAYGIWGGTSAEDRRDMKSKRRKYKLND
jgi:WhiB family transcriptional regulator, redox-sensing transcriptional regulator